MTVQVPRVMTSVTAPHRRWYKTVPRTWEKSCVGRVSFRGASTVT